MIDIEQKVRIVFQGTTENKVFKRAWKPAYKKRHQNLLPRDQLAHLCNQFSSDDVLMYNILVYSRLSCVWLSQDPN